MSAGQDSSSTGIYSGSYQTPYILNCLIQAIFSQSQASSIFKHVFPHTKLYGQMQHSPFMYVRGSQSTLFPNTQGHYTPLIVTQTFCSSLHSSFPNCPYPRLSAAVIPKASQTPAGPHRLHAGVQTQLPAFQALDTNLLCCSAICASLKAECRKKLHP